MAFESDDGSAPAVFIYELSGQTSMRHLTLTGSNHFPIWSAGSQRVAFQSAREGDNGIFWQRADGTGPTERLTKSEEGISHFPQSLSPNGDVLLFEERKGVMRTLWSLSLRDKKVDRFGAFESTESIDAVFSPDGRWVAYDSTESRSNNTSIYVEPFPPTGTKYQVTKGPGRNVFWSPDGKELVYTPAAGQWASIAISTQPSFAFGNPELIPRGGTGGLGGPDAARSYDPHPDGKRIIGVVLAAAAVSQLGYTAGQRIQVVLNWTEELKRLVP